ncbi:UMP kinase [candidate division TA06 bacterium B3_TA06]|uniref:Uridylate kinase n=1 Tax=candidate division TA06 bacterium B3_TA06 TaxID=2012487 RepID=A0A532V6L7_UNCT6|nr:MAG: UMP kinase [candidate division TA06 bacterium B3_TA06]
MKKINKTSRDLKDEGLLLKLSGEVFSHAEVLDGIVGEIANLAGRVRLAVLLGGGNHVRGAWSGLSGEARVFADRMGMIGSLLNGLRLESMLRDAGICAVHMSAVSIAWVSRYDPVGARDAFNDRKLLIFSGGTGLPYFSTDTSAVLRAVEIGAHRVLKGTKVKGVYSDDPEKNQQARFFKELSYAEALAQNLAVMDQTAFSLAREYDLIVQVFDVFCPENIGRIVRGHRVGTIIKRGVGA